jgi:VanZ family protein
MPAGDLPQCPLFNIPCFDKLVHGGLFSILALLIVVPLHKTRLKVGLIAFVYTVFLGGLLELIQSYFTVSRSGSWTDLAADAIGAILGIVGGKFVFYIDWPIKNPKSQIK